MTSALFKVVGDHKEVIPTVHKTEHFVMSHGKTLCSISALSQNQNKNIQRVLLGCKNLRVGCYFFYFLNDYYSSKVPCQVER